MKDIYVKTAEGTVASTKPVEENIIVDYDEEGKVIGVEVLGVREIVMGGTNRIRFH